MRYQFGIVAADPLRMLGLRTIFEQKDAEIVMLTGDDAAVLPTLSLVLIDAACTEHLFELVTEFRQARPSMKLVVMGLEHEAAYIERVIGAGVKGYLTHDATASEILMAIDIVLDGSVWAPRKVLASLIESDQLARQRLAAEPVLTKRERDVLQLLTDGLTNKQIGSALTIDEATVKAHVGRVMRKAGVSNRTALSVRAMEWRSLSTDTKVENADSSRDRRSQ